MSVCHESSGLANSSLGGQIRKIARQALSLGAEVSFSAQNLNMHPSSAANSWSWCMRRASWVGSWQSRTLPLRLAPPITIAVLLHAVGAVAEMMGIAPTQLRAGQIMPTTIHFSRQTWHLACLPTDYREGFLHAPRPLRLRQESDCSSLRRRRVWQ